MARGTSRYDAARLQNWLWSPFAIGDALSVWWDPSQGITASGGTVSSWVDRIQGLAATQATGANQPGYGFRNNKRRLTFNGSQWLSVSSPLLRDSLSVGTYAVSAYSAISGTGQPFVFGFGSGAGNLRALYQLSDGTVSGGVGTDITTGTTWTATDRLVMFTAGASALGVRVDGSAVGSSAQSLASGGSGSGAIGYWPGFGAKWNGDIGHFMIFTRVLTANEMELLEGWESWEDGKNGSNLPAAHRFKNRPPMISDAGSAVSQVSAAVYLRRLRGVDRYDEAQRQGRLWTPAADPSRMTAWYDCTQFNAVADGSGNVSNWRDLSGKGNNATQSTAGWYPAWTPNKINGRPGLTNGAATTLNLAAPLAAADYTVYCVFEFTGSSGQYRTIIGNGNVNTNYPYIGIMSSGSNFMMGRGRVIDELSKAIPSVGYHVGSARFAYLSGSGNVLTIGVNGDMASASTSATTYSIGSDQIFADRWSSALVGGAGELLIFVGRHTDAEMRRIEGYMAWKWGLQDKLVASHPYKNRPPLIGA